MEGVHPVKRSLPAVIIASFVLLIAAGCQPTNIANSGQSEAVDPNSPLLREILEYQKKSGQDISRMLDDIKTQQAAREAGQGPHPLVIDLAVAQQLTAEAKETDDPKELVGLLHRLQFVLAAMQSESPAGQITTYIERARLELLREQPSENDVAAASKQLMAALESGLHVEPAEIVPPVLTKLEAAKKTLDEGDASAARRLMDEAQTVASGHKINSLLRKALAACKGAEEALNRGARGVVAAEMDELTARLDNIETIAVVQQPTETATETETETSSDAAQTSGTPLPSPATSSAGEQPSAEDSQPTPTAPAATVAPTPPPAAPARPAASQPAL